MSAAVSFLRLTKVQHLRPAALLLNRGFGRDIMDKPIENAIITKLTEALKPVHLQVLNESPGHNVPRGAESHFRVLIVSEAFKDQTLVKRHRLVHDALKEELKGAIHALSIQAKSPEQWNETVTMDKSPPCQGGHGQ